MAFRQSPEALGVTGLGVSSHTTYMLLPVLGSDLQGSAFSGWKSQSPRRESSLRSSFPTTNSPDQAPSRLLKTAQAMPREFGRGWGE